jgi:ubiquinone/menaquinone biosynthesis C-methylase UbiE
MLGSTLKFERQRALFGQNRGFEQAGSADDYKVATATNLPFADGTFDLAIAYNVLMDIEDVPTAPREIRRVLR